MGVIANDPRFLGGAIDGEGARRPAASCRCAMPSAFRFSRSATRPASWLALTVKLARGSSRQPHVCGRSVAQGSIFHGRAEKGVWSGAQAMSAGDFSAPAMIVAWPTAEFGPMGLEGAVRLGYRKELEAEPDLEKRQAMFDARLARMYEAGKAVSVAEVLEIDAVIDPRDTALGCLAG